MVMAVRIAAVIYNLEPEATKTYFIRKGQQGVRRKKMIKRSILFMILRTI